MPVVKKAANKARNQRAREERLSAGALTSGEAGLRGQVKSSPARARTWDTRINPGAPGLLYQLCNGDPFRSLSRIHRDDFIDLISFSR